MRSAYASFSLAALLMIISASPAWAGITVKEPIFEAEISPGMQIIHEMNISIDASDVPMDFQANIFGLDLRPDGGIFELNPENDTGLFTARPFLHISPSSFHLNPGESRKITITGRIPDSIGEGCRYALARVQSAPIGEKSFAFILALNIPILLCPNSTVKSGKITDLKLNLSGDQAIDIRFDLKNTGNTHLRASVAVQLKDETGIIKGNASMPLTTSILPQDLRNIELSLHPNEPLVSRNYTIECRAFLRDGSLIDEMIGYYKLPLIGSRATGEDLI